MREPFPPPASVRATIACLSALGLRCADDAASWPRLAQGRLDCIISPNLSALPAFTCADAASKRVRNGVPGVPLADELKSWLGRLSKRDGGTLVMLHCRGDQRFDLDRAANVLNVRRQPTWAVLPDLAPYTVNPISAVIFNSLHPDDRIVQLFDGQLVADVGTTVTTNAGDTRWTMELRVASLVRALQRHCPFEARVVESLAANGIGVDDGPCETSREQTLLPGHVRCPRP